MARAKNKSSNPERYADITKSFIIEYIRAYGSDEDKAWFLALIENPDNQITRNTKNGKKPDMKMSVVRREFCMRFNKFSKLLPENKDNGDFITTIKDTFGIE